jgi:uncharacterized Zn-finger protein
MTYNCEICNYESTDKSNYNRHLKSSMHTIKINSNRPKKGFDCKCGKKFAYLSGLSRHKKNAI